MICTRCGHEKVFQFEGGQGARAGAALPQVCRSCGLITVSGVEVSFPPELEAQAKNLAEISAAAAASTKEEIIADPDHRIDAYLKTFYERAYLDGFFRALAYFRHDAKVGRLKRLRELWMSAERATDHGPVTKISMEVAVYDELQQLLELGGSDGSRSSHQHPPVRSGQPRVP